MINQSLSLILALVTGILLGAIFFGGLWWTVRACVSSKHPALLFLASRLLRTAIVLIGFYFVANGDWEKLVACLLGFMVARFCATHSNRASKTPNYAAPLSERQQAVLRPVNRAP